jgi:DNA-binding transcriptional MerR regulator
VDKSGSAAPQTEERLFSSREVSVISGVTGRQLQWWDENEIISPLRRDGRRAYDTQQLLEVLVIAAFRRKQLSLQKIRRVMRLLRRKKGRESGKDRGGSGMYVLTDGHTVHLEDQPDHILSLLSESARSMYVVCLDDQIRRIESYNEVQRRAKRQLALF